MKLQVLVTTMHQTDFSKYTQMNLQTDAVFANQTDRNEFVETQIGGCNVKLISTDSRGLSRNRNIALVHTKQDTDLILFADDDLVFNNGYERAILEEFEKHPEAEAIKFNIHDLSETRKLSMRRIKKFEKATRRNMSSSGVCGAAIKNTVIRENNLHFHENFGAGAANYCGEDTIFLMDMIDKHIKFYRSPVDIAGIDQTESAWFEGFNERYFRTAGKVLGTCYPMLSYLIVIRSAFKAHKRENCKLGFWKVLGCYYEGIQSK